MITNHNTIPFVGLKTLQSSLRCVMIDGRRRRMFKVGAIGRIMAGLELYAHFTNILMTVRGVMVVGIAHRTSWYGGWECSGRKWLWTQGERKHRMAHFVIVVYLY